LQAACLVAGAEALSFVELMEGVVARMARKPVHVSFTLHRFSLGGWGWEKPIEYGWVVSCRGGYVGVRWGMGWRCTGLVIG
jgi:hypothetical protein